MTRTATHVDEDTQVPPQCHLISWYCQQVSAVYAIHGPAVMVPMWFDVFVSCGFGPRAG